MEREQKFIFYNRLMWFLITAASIVLTICVLSSAYNDLIYGDGDGLVFLALVYILPFVDFIIFSIFACTLCLHCKTYTFRGNSIVVYAGFCNHYIKANGVKCDEHNTLISFTPIVMSCKLDDGTMLQATISMSNRIALKANDKLLYSL